MHMSSQSTTNTDDRKKHEENTNKENKDKEKVTTAEMLMALNQEEASVTFGEDEDSVVNDIPINESSESSEDDQKKSIPTTKKRRNTCTTFSTTGMPIKGYILDDENKKCRHYVKKSEDGYARSYVLCGAGTGLHCEHCKRAGEIPKDRTYKTMHNHLHSTNKNIRCKHIETHPLRKPKTLLNICHDIKRGNTNNYVTIENAEAFIKSFFISNLNYSIDEINVLVEWEIYDLEEDEDTAFPMRKSQWDTHHEAWKTAILEAHQGEDNAYYAWHGLRKKQLEAMHEEFEKNIIITHNKHNSDKSLSKGALSNLTIINAAYMWLGPCFNTPCTRDVFFKTFNMISDLSYEDFSMFLNPDGIIDDTTISFKGSIGSDRKSSNEEEQEEKPLRRSERIRN